MAADTLQRRALGAAPAMPEREVPALDLAALYAAQFGYVFRCLRSLGVREPGLDDALQDVFLVVRDKLSDFDGAAQLRTWLYAIALRVARRYRERAAVDAVKFVSDDALGSAGAGSPEQRVEHHEQLALAQRALDALGDEKREVFVLAHVEQLSAPEIAEITGAPLNTVYSRLRAARSEFAAHAARLQLGHARRSP